MSLTFEFQACDVSRALTPSCYLPADKEARGMKLVRDVIMYSMQTGTEKTVVAVLNLVLILKLNLVPQNCTPGWRDTTCMMFFKNKETTK